MTQEHLRVCTLTLNNEGGMDQDPTHTTEWLIYYRMYIMSQLIYYRVYIMSQLIYYQMYMSQLIYYHMYMSQCRNVMLSRGTSILTLMNIECCTSHSVLHVQVAVKLADRKDNLIW